MKKGLILGLAAGAAAATAAILYFKKKKEDYYYDEEFDDEDYDCDCCGCDCDCDDDCECGEAIPAEKAEESMIVTDACVACAASEEEALDTLEDEVESDEV